MLNGKLGNIVILSIFVDKNFILKLNTRYMKSIIPFVTKER
nr:MAG TPA: hypothetical protein [Caudoviricetes sp.]